MDKLKALESTRHRDTEAFITGLERAEKLQVRTFFSLSTLLGSLSLLAVYPPPTYSLQKKSI